MATTASTLAEDRISRGYIYFFGSFGGILFGYDIGVMTGALPFLQNDWNLTGQAGIIGWITSSLMLGAILGGALATTLADLAARTMITGADLPLGMLTSIVGGPLFFWLLLRSKRAVH